MTTVHPSQQGEDLSNEDVEDEVSLTPGMSPATTADAKATSHENVSSLTNNTKGLLKGRQSGARLRPHHPCLRPHHHRRHPIPVVTIHVHITTAHIAITIAIAIAVLTIPAAVPIPTTYATRRCPIVIAIIIEPIFSSPAATAPESFKPPTSPTHAKASPCFPTLQAPSAASALSPWLSPPPTPRCMQTNHDTNPPRAGPRPGHTPTNQKAHTATLRATSTTACQGPMGVRYDVYRAKSTGSEERKSVKTQFGDAQVSLGFPGTEDSSR
ncbi:hypothetical protein EDB86DRAFT_3085067 [Lactarius hatsudake]|nr:hypothetical protein EDB86DRAFT_3085067 [Lactarius hatsudake]